MYEKLKTSFEVLLDTVFLQKRFPFACDRYDARTETIPHVTTGSEMSFRICEVCFPSCSLLLLGHSLLGVPTRSLWCLSASLILGPCQSHEALKSSTQPSASQPLALPSPGGKYSLHGYAPYSWLVSLFSILVPQILTILVALEWFKQMPSNISSCFSSTYWKFSPNCLNQFQPEEPSLFPDKTYFSCEVWSLTGLSSNPSCCLV